MHCASLLHIISCEISVRTLKNGGFFFVAEPRHGGKSPFSRKRVWWPIIFFCCFELSKKFLYVRMMCILCTPRPIYRSTSRSLYRLTLDQCISRHIGWHSGRHIGQVSVDVSTDLSTEISAEWWSIRWPLTVGVISVDRRWYISQKLTLLLSDV